MKNVLVAFGLCVLGPSTAFALPTATAYKVAAAVQTKETQCLEPQKLGPDPASMDDVVKKVRKGKHKKRAAEPKPVRRADPSIEEVKAYVEATSAVDPALVLAICQVESTFHTMALAHGKGSGHYGLMQLAPATARSMGFSGKASDLYDWQTNVRFGARYVAYLQALYGHTNAAIASYNSGAPFYRKRPGKPAVLVNQGYVTHVNKAYGVFKKRFYSSDAGPK